LAGLEFLTVERHGNNLVARTRGERDRRLLLAGHLDTVPHTDPPQPLEHTATEVAGRGAVDMKSGVAVLLALAEQAAESASCECTFVFYEREELGSHQSGMQELARSWPRLLAADAAILLEPTGGWVEPGCQGSLRVQATYHGTAAHTARPWRGVNAIARALPDLTRVASTTLPEIVIDGLVYPQALQLVGVRSGGDSNVVPDRLTAHLNLRYAPGGTSADALAILRQLLADADTLEVTLDSPAGLASFADPALARLRDLVGDRVRPKLGWTDVGRMGQLGIPAVNYGPGDSELAHGPVERVSLAELVEVYQTLVEMLSS
jgi:succinyl-diaminopimelate desuccinylase